MKNIKKIMLSSFLTFSIAYSSLGLTNLTYADAIKADVNSFLSFNELVNLSKNQYPDGELGYKLQYILNTPIVNNSINPHSKIVDKSSADMGKFIRIAQWNIARGINYENIKLLLSEPEKLTDKIKENADYEKERIFDEAKKFQSADIILLNEVDNGMPRTDYKDITRELATTLKYNYAYGVEFLEIDPAHLGQESYEWSEERFLFPDKKYVVDKDKYKGLHGNAILSRYPLHNVRIVRLPKAYDWFKSERDKITELETIKRHAAEKIFKEELLREIRHGSRMAIIADVTIPETHQTITIVNAHLENRTIPARRLVQLNTILDTIKDIDNPVVLAGDFNTTITDGSPTGVKKEVVKRVTDFDFMARNAFFMVLPVAGFFNMSLTSGNLVRRYTDPTVKHIPIFGPNKERPFFDRLKEFTFADGHKFDFRGLEHKTRTGKDGLMSQSNERHFKGFVPTFLFERPIIIGRYKLDWIFVKSYSRDCKDNKQSFKLAPHFGSTLRALNYSFNPILSDHVPITVDLPINEPPVNWKKPENWVKPKELKEPKEKNQPSHLEDSI